MKCPYCVSVIDDAALACPHCARDLYLFKPLLVRIAALEEELGRAGERITALESGGATAPLAEPVAPAGPVAPVAATPAWGFMLPALVLLLAAHFLIVMSLDLPTLWLRLASLGIPLPFGYLLMRRAPQRSLFKNMLAAGGLALLAVTGMSAVVALADGTPVLPANGREWREFLYYAASIMLSFSTGMIVGRLGEGAADRLAPLYRSALLLRLITALWGAARDPAKVQKQVDAVRNLVGTVAATATAVASVTSGLSGVIGG
ncbi:MAG TPA: hypothetical protein VJN44_14910 [Roseateles sp.]|nr:hypothetical protein [Roseateles sp.]